MSVKKASISRTDYGNAQRLVALHGHELRYSYQWKKWLSWTGTRWKVDDAGNVVNKAKRSILMMYAEVAKAHNDSERDELAKHAKASSSARAIKAMIELAQSEPGIPVTTDDLDCDAWLFNTATGTIDLRTGELKSHDPKDLITKQSLVAYSPDAQCPVFERFMREIFNGDDDLIEHIERYLGYCLTGDIRHHLLPIWYGVGANGKSTLIDTVLYIMGEYAGPAPDSLMVKSSREEHPCDVADCFGRRLIVASETEDQKQLRIAMVKKLTGDEFIKARFQKMDYFTFRRSHKSILITNNRPTITENSNAIWRRLRLLPFDVIIPKEKQDAALPEALKAEAPGILARLVRACQRWQQDGFELTEPKAVAVATDHYRVDESAEGEETFDRFFEAKLVQSQGGFITRTELYGEYKNFCQAAKVDRPMSRSKLYERVRQLDGVKDGAEHGGKRGFDSLSVARRAEFDVPD